MNTKKIPFNQFIKLKMFTKTDTILLSSTKWSKIH